MSVRPAEDTEADAVRGVARGDHDAFAGLVGRTRDGLWRLLRSLTRDDRAAEEALQETWLALWRAAATWRGESSARTWLYAVARRQAARTWRRRAGEPTEALPLHEVGPLVGPGRDPEDAVLAAEAGTHLRAALAALSAEDRKLILLVALQGLTPSEVAAMTGATANATRVRLHRARSRLLDEVEVQGATRRR